MVVQVGDENNYVIRDVVRNKKRRVHYNRLKPCYRREQVHEEVIAAEEAEDSIQGAHRETQHPTGAREDWGVEHTSEQDDEPLLLPVELNPPDREGVVQRNNSPEELPQHHRRGQWRRQHQ